MLDESFFVDGIAQKREVELPDGKKHNLYFKEASAIAFRKFRLAEDSTDPDVRAGSISILIAASLCNEDGSAAITIEQAHSLKAAPMAAIFSQVLDVNKAQKEPGKV